MRRLLIVLALGIVGSALLMEVSSLSTIGPVKISGFFLMAVLTPIVLRILGVGSSYQQMFVNCMGTGMIMGTVQWTWIVFVDSPSPKPWYAYPLSYVFLAGCIAVGSAFAAPAAWKPAPRNEPAYRRRMLDIVNSAGTFFVCYSAVYLWTGSSGPKRVFGILSWAAFLAFFFASVSIAIYLPVLLTTGRALGTFRTRLPLAFVGAMLFPIPLLVFPFLQGRLGSTWLFLAQNPGTILWVSLPYVVAGAVLGWWMAERSRQSTSAA